MSRVLLALCVVILAVAPVAAGPNSNGGIIVHTNDAYDYLSTTICTTPLGLPATCADAITRTDKATGAVVWFMASFLPQTFPVVTAIYFGMTLDAVNLDASTKYGICGPQGSVEIPDAGWPGDGVGNSVAFGSAVTGSTLFPFYFFKVDDYSGLPGPYLCSGINPLGGYAAFYDDSHPPAQDDIAQFGCVKWYQDGANACALPPVLGACCDPTMGFCTITVESSCQTPRVWYAGWLSCVPNPCPGALGACCDPVTGACTTVPLAACQPPRTWIQDWLDCWPNPCPGATGICCDLATGACVITTATSCPPPMFWNSGEHSCLPNPCPQPVAACCVPDGACTLTADTDCQYPGVWYGDWVSCSPNPCPQPVPGPNAGGAIVVHTNDSYDYLSTTICSTTLLPETCEDAITSASRDVGQVVWFLAAFLPTASPRVLAVCFGIDFDEVNLDSSVRRGICGPAGSVEVPDSGWPANLAGNLVQFGNTIVGDTFFPFYYFQIDNNSGGIGNPYFCSDINPTVGYASFIDDSSPRISDRITRFGCVKWYGAGSNECPGAASIGACCFLDGHCEMLSEQQCMGSPEYQQWIGPGTACLPNNPCAPQMGACCSPDDGCVVTAAAACQAPNVWFPEWTTCQPNPCSVPVPTERTTWGRIKAGYR
jgi:hypothetical protein